MVDRVKYIPPSGVRDGSVDGYVIQSAIDAALATGDVWTLAFAGKYYIECGLRIGKQSETSGNVCSMIGLSDARLRYVGPRTSDPLLGIYGGGLNKNDETTVAYRTMMGGLTLDCNRLCRGVSLLSQTYGRAFEKIWIERAEEIAVDVMSGWASTFRDIHIRQTRGMAMRVRAAYGATFEAIKIRDTAGATHANDTPADNWGLWQHEMEYGRDSARERYGEQYIEHWPPEDDTSVIDHTGNPIRVRPDRRCALLMTSLGAVTWRDCVFEHNAMGDYPVILTDTACNNITFDRSYWEANYTRHEKVLVAAGATPSDSWVHGIRFRDVYLSDRRGNDNQLRCSCFVRQRGMASDILVDGIDARGLSDNVFCCDGGEHYGRVAIAAHTSDETIRPDVWDGAVNGGAIYPDRVSYGRNHEALWTPQQS